MMSFEITNEAPQGTFAIGGLVFETEIDGPTVETPALDRMESYNDFLALFEGANEVPVPGGVVGGLFEI